MAEELDEYVIMDAEAISPEDSETTEGCTVQTFNLQKQRNQEYL